MFGNGSLGFRESVMDEPLSLATIEDTASGSSAAEPTSCPSTKVVRHRPCGLLRHGWASASFSPSISVPVLWGAALKSTRRLNVRRLGSAGWVQAPE
jgi:hypothetical protein